MFRNMNLEGRFCNYASNHSKRKPSCSSDCFQNDLGFRIQLYFQGMDAKLRSQMTKYFLPLSRSAEIQQVFDLVNITHFPGLNWGRQAACGQKDKISARFTSVCPPITMLFKRPFRTSFEIACREIPRRRAASA